MVIQEKAYLIMTRLADTASPGCVRGYKARALMPFVQMENIQLFIEACRKVFGLREHDLFVTANLYEDKDMLQVLRCLGAFSRWAHREKPALFPREIGGKTRLGPMTPEATGNSQRARGISMTSTTSSSYSSLAARPPSIAGSMRPSDATGRRSPVKTGSPASQTPTGVSSWSKKVDEGATSPAWNIAQYGYMGGASQGNLGVSFGGRRQITSAGPQVPSLADKEKQRREQEIQAEEERKRRAEEARQEARAQEAEQARWAEETRKLEQKRREDEKRAWEEEERRWRADEEQRLKDEREAEQKLRDERSKARTTSDARLQGQFLSQYQAENRGKGGDAANDSTESARIKDLERQLAEARDRERRYEEERAAKKRQTGSQEHSSTAAPPRSEPRSDLSVHDRARSRSRPRSAVRKTSDDSRPEVEREQLRRDWQTHHTASEESPPAKPPRPLPGSLSTHAEQPPPKPARPLPEPQGVTQTPSDTQQPPPKPARPLPEPLDVTQAPSDTQQPPPKPSRPLPEPEMTTLPVRVKTNTTGPSSRPLPDPAEYAMSNPTRNRTDRFLATHAAPEPASSRTTYSSELGGFDSTAERDAEDQRRVASQSKTKAGGWASKSLLEREMEMERQRQKEWEEAQKETQTKTTQGDAGVDGIGGGIGGKWDVNQWTGYTGGDGQNRGAQGIGAGRRQIVGPRPPPGR